MKNQKFHLVAVFVNLEDMDYEQFTTLRHFLKRNLGFTANKLRQYFFITSLNDQESFRLQELTLDINLQYPGQNFFRSSYITGNYDIENVFTHLSSMMQEKRA